MALLVHGHQMLENLLDKYRAFEGEGCMNLYERSTVVEHLLSLLWSADSTGHYYRYKALALLIYIFQSSERVFENRGAGKLAVLHRTTGIIEIVSGAGNYEAVDSVAQCSVYGKIYLILRKIRRELDQNGVVVVVEAPGTFTNCIPAVPCAVISKGHSMPSPAVKLTLSDT